MDLTARPAARPAPAAGSLVRIEHYQYGTLRRTTTTAEITSVGETQIACRAAHTGWPFVIDIDNILAIDGRDPEPTLAARR